MPASGETVENTGGTASGHREDPPAPAAAPSWKFQLLCMRLDNVRHGYMAISFNLHGLFFIF